MSSYEQRMQDTADAATGTGWLSFAGILFFVAGIFHVIDGIAALSKAHTFNPGSRGDGLFANIHFWGVVMLIIGGLAIFAGYALLNRMASGRIIGIFLASLGIIAQLMFLSANESWALIMIAIWLMILYGLIVRGDEFDSPTAA